MPFKKNLLRKLRTVICVIKSFTWRKVVALPSSSRVQRRCPETSTIYPYDADETSSPWHDCNVLERGEDERHASLADLCTHVGDQLPTQVVKLIARDVLRELEYLHEAQDVAHCDLDLRNIVVSSHDMKALIAQICAESPTSLPPSHTSLDFFLDVNSVLTSTSSPVFRLCNIDTDSLDLRVLADGTAMRAPEIILGAPSNSSADLWSLGCILYELLSGERLFDPSFQTEELGLSAEESHLIQIIELFGEFPLDLLRAGEYSSRWFTDSGQLKLETNYYPESLEALLRSRMDGGEVIPTAAFITTLLQIRPQDRTAAADLINHPWFTG